MHAAGHSLKLPLAVLGPPYDLLLMLFRGLPQNYRNRHDGLLHYDLVIDCDIILHR